MRNVREMVKNDDEVAVLQNGLDHDLEREPWKYRPRFGHNAVMASAPKKMTRCWLPAHDSAPERGSPPSRGHRRRAVDSTEALLIFVFFPPVGGIPLGNGKATN